MSNFSINSPVDFESLSFITQSELFTSSHKIDNFYAVSNGEQSIVNNEKTDFSKKSIDFKINLPSQLVKVNIRPKSGLIYPR